MLWLWGGLGAKDLIRLETSKGGGNAPKKKKKKKKKMGEREDDENDRIESKLIMQKGCGEWLEPRSDRQEGVGIGAKVEGGVQLC